MNQIKAFKIAYEYFEKEMHISGISAAGETSDKWIFSVTPIPLVTKIISISKEDFSIKEMDKLARSTREEIASGHKIEIPDEYKFIK